TVVGMAIFLYIFVILDLSETAEHAKNLEIEFYKKEKEREHDMFEQTAAALASAIDAKDRYTRGHSSRVAAYSQMIAKDAGRSEEEIEQIYFAALLHDVGKIGIADSIINKEGRLTDEEFAQIKRHPIYGSQILSQIHQSPNLYIGARHHHERYDGRGYPDGLSGENIPELARIIGVADSYDAMTSKRSYRDTMPQEKVRSELVKGRGTQFDPRFADIMIRRIDLDTGYKMREEI
ncbi:MAG: HD-GYP domain-containing protein, partial [Firmicutes bacterium]|nr:HD-GYP domain-containing protein [Bacillota bacterium]